MAETVFKVRKVKAKNDVAVTDTIFVHSNIETQMQDI